MIDWTLPVETTEDPPRPVRVLAQFDWNGDAVTLAEMPNGLAMVFTAEGKNLAAGVTLRNVPPPKPELVQYELWINLYSDGVVGTTHRSVAAADKASLHRKGRVECRRIAWMSDGSPVEDDPLRYGVCETCVEKAVKSADEWRTKAEALQGEVDTLKKALFQMQEAAKSMVPVVDAAVAWVRRTEKYNRRIELFSAVRTFLSQQASAEPVKKCKTCGFDAPIQVGAPCVKCSNYSEWRPRHD